MQRALLLINPNSRNGRADIEPALAMLRRGGIDLVTPPSGPDQDIDRLIGELSGGVDLVIVGGGDGTLNRAVDAIVTLGRPLGILPLGTANDLARTLSLPTGIEDSARIVLLGRTRRIDLGQVNGKHFFNVASLGISSDVARALDHELKVQLGVLGYPVSLWRVVAKRRVIRAELRCDGRPIKVRAIQISIGNGRFYGGGMSIAADADIDDGRLDLVIMAQQPLWRLIRNLPLFRWGRHDLNDTVRHVRGREISLATRPPLPINTDGEVTTSTPADFRLMPKALEVFVP